MKKAALYIIAAILIAVCAPAFAQQFPDVPQDHWAYAAVQDLASKGVIQGYPDGTFGGKRALTRYEFAQAIEKAIPVIAGMCKTEGGACGPCGPQGPKGEPGCPGVSPETVAALQKLVDEFRDELSALNVDVQGLKRDLAALATRVAAVEAEQARVHITAEADMYARGLVDTGATPGSDRDNRSLNINGALNTNPLSNTTWFNDFELGIRGKVSNNASVNTLIAAGNLLNFELTREGATTAGLNEFTLWNMYLDGAVKMGPLGNAQLVVGRFPLQLTPQTLKMVPLDAYNSLGKIDNGDYIFDGGRMSFSYGKLGLTAFAAKAGVLGANLDSPNLLLGRGTALNPTSLDTGVPTSQLAGLRAIYGTPWDFNIGATYLQTGQDVGQAQIYGADINGSFAKIGFTGEYTVSKPTNSLQGSNILVSPNVAFSDDEDNAWNAKLSYQWGAFQVGGGYATIERNFFAPGYWSTTGRAVNLTNVKGPMVNLSYAISPRITFTASGEQWTPNQDNFAVTGRTTIDQGRAVAIDPSIAGAAALDLVDHWQAGLRYGLGSVNSVDLGYEEAQWKPTGGTSTTGFGGTGKERYITIGLGHQFNSNTGLKLLYQIVEYRAGAVDPYQLLGNTGNDMRGGVAAAQFQLRY